MTDLSEIKKLANYRPTHKVRFVTAASLFDGHDASINIMRRILQSMGAEVIHLGHDRSVEQIVTAALQEDVQGIAISSYQGGHVEFFKYMIDLLRERGGENIRVYGGGGGVIVGPEIKELHDYGVARIFSPEDGQTTRPAGNDRIDGRRVRRRSGAARADIARRAERQGSDEALARAGARDHRVGARRSRRRSFANRCTRRPTPRRCRRSASPAPAARASRACATSSCAASASIRATSCRSR